MAMLLRTSKRKIALSLRIICLLTVTLTFIIVTFVNNRKHSDVRTVRKESGIVTTFCIILEGFYTFAIIASS